MHTFSPVIASSDLAFGARSCAVVERAVQQAKLAQDQSAAETARQQARAEHLQTRHVVCLLYFIVLVQKQDRRKIESGPLHV